MHPKTLQLKSGIKTAQTLQEKIERLRDFYDGETMYVVTCGPSLKSIDTNRLRQKLEGRLVMTVKQAYALLGGLSDFHVYNNFNHQKYDYDQDGLPIRVFGYDPKCPEVVGPRPDITLIVDPLFEKPEGALDNKLMHSLDFDRFLLSRTPIRPCGYGILYEVVFYLAVHLGVRRCVVLGWDLAPREADYGRFYPRRQMPAILRKAISATRFIAGRRRAEWLRRRVLYASGYVYNELGSLPGEMTPLIASTRYVYEWLKRHGVDLAVVSSSSYVDPVIPRMTLEDM